jgi:hypothetical protein
MTVYLTRPQPATLEVPVRYAHVTALLPAMACQRMAILPRE